LLLLPVLVAIGLWWVTWPERTARRFVALLAAGDFVRARAMSEEPGPTEAFWTIVKWNECEFEAAELEPTSVRESLAAERKFSIRTKEGPSAAIGPFVARRNRVTREPFSGKSKSLVVYSLQTGSPGEITDQLKQFYRRDDSVSIIPIMPSRSIVVRAPEAVQREVQVLISVLENDQDLIDWPKLKGAR
jgi:hypothetical protein